MGSVKLKDLKAFVRYDGSGRVVSGSLVFRKKKPKNGRWGEITKNLCCTDSGSSTTTTTTFANTTDTTTTVSGIIVTISHDNMFDPICSATTTLPIQIVSGTSLSNALTISGDFASLGAYYTPADPGNPMSQPPRFDIRYEVNGSIRNRYFTLTGVGIASGFDPMFGLSQEQFCL